MNQARGHFIQTEGWWNWMAHQKAKSFIWKGGNVNIRIREQWLSIIFQIAENRYPSSRYGVTVHFESEFLSKLTRWFDWCSCNVENNFTTSVSSWTNITLVKESLIWVTSLTHIYWTWLAGNTVNALRRWNRIRYFGDGIKRGLTFCFHRTFPKLSVSL